MGKENFGCSAQEHDDLKVMTHHIQSATKIKCDPRKKLLPGSLSPIPKKGGHGGKGKRTKDEQLRAHGHGLERAKDERRNK